MEFFLIQMVKAVIRHSTLLTAGDLSPRNTPSPELLQISLKKTAKEVGLDFPKLAFPFQVSR